MAGEVVFITGISGHVGFRVLATALAAGYRVTAAVRKSDQIDTIKATKSIKPHLDRLEMAVVPDILKPGAFDAALNGATYVIHVASPLGHETDNPERDIIEPALKATVNILESAHRTPSIKRVVITSSIAVIAAGRAEDKHRVYNEADVIPRPVRPYGSSMQAYGNSKALAYYATLDWIKENKPVFDVINMKPAFVIGANELNKTVEEMVAGSNALVMRPLLGVTVDTPANFYTVHVDDVATAHVKALDPAVKGNQSFLLAVPNQMGSWNDAIEITKKLFPGAETNLPLNGSVPSKTFLVDSSKAEKDLGLRFKSFEEQVRSLVEHLIELKNAE